MLYGRMQAACFIAFRRSVTSSFLVLTSLSYTSFYFAYPAPAFERRTARVVHSIGKTEQSHSFITLHGFLPTLNAKCCLNKLSLCPFHKKAQCSFISPFAFSLPLSFPHLPLFVPHKKPTLQSVCMLFIFCELFTLPKYNYNIPFVLRLLKNGFHRKN